MLIFLIGLGVFYKVQSDIKDLSEKIQTSEVKVDQKRETAVNLEAGEPINVLVIGADGDQDARKEEDGFVSRSDTIMIISLNPETKTTKMVSIPRDTATLIEGHEGADKINHAYAYGGVELAVETVQDFLDIPIDYYAVVNMSGLAALIDAVDGITVTSPLTFTYRGTSFKEGETREVNGIKAMNFARMRYDDPQGEMGRQNRQKMVIKAILDKALSLNAVTYYPKILEVVAKNVQTNYDISTLLSVYPKYVPALSSISSIQFENLENLYIEGVFYFHIPLTSRLKVSNELRLHTNLPMSSISSLKDPLESSATTDYTKAKTVILNQYPSGMTQEEIERLNAAQEAIIQVQQEESYDPGYVEDYYYNTTININTNSNNSNYNWETTYVVPPTSASYSESEVEPVPDQPVETEAPSIVEPVVPPVEEVISESAGE